MRTGVHYIYFCKQGHIGVYLCKQGHIRVYLCKQGHIRVYLCKQGHIRVYLCKQGLFRACLCKQVHIRVYLCKLRGTLESISANRGTLGSFSANMGTLESMSASRFYLRKQVHIRVYLIPGQRACSLRVSYVHNNWGKYRQLEGRELVLHASLLPAVIEYNNYYVHILVLKFLCTYIFVDLVKHGVLTLVGEIRYYRNNRYCCFVSRDSSVVESRILDRKVADSSRYRQERREEFYSPGSTFCADCYFGIRSTPVLPQYHVC